MSSFSLLKAILLLGIVYIVISPVMAITVGSGECYSFYPGGTGSTIVTIGLNGSPVTITDEVPLTICGGNVTFADEYCTVHETIQAGDVFTRIGGRCDVVIYTEDTETPYSSCDSCCQAVSFTNYSIDVLINGDNQGVSIRYNGEEFKTNFSVIDAYSYSFRDEISCPLSTAVKNITLNDCANYINLIDQGSFLAKSIETTNSCSLDLSSCYGRLTNCVSDKVNLNGDKERCETNLGNCRDTANTCLGAMDNQSVMFESRIVNESLLCENRLLLNDRARGNNETFLIWALIISWIVFVVFLLVKEGGDIFG